MRKPFVELVAVWIGLLAYSVGPSAWGFVECEEPDGRVAIELAGDHSSCQALVATGHQHGKTTQDPESCETCSSCPCTDTPLTLELAPLGKRISLKHLPATDRGGPPPSSLPARGSKDHLVSVVRANISPTAQCPMQRYLRCVVLLV